MIDIGRAIDAAITQMLIIAALFGAACVGAIFGLYWIASHIYWEWV